MEIMNLKDVDKTSTIERIMKTAETEKLVIIKTSEAEKLEIVKIKEAENQNAQWEIKKCKQSKLRTENMCSVRGALEFIRSKIWSNGNPSIFEEPFDKTLLRLSEDKKFMNFLQKTCDENHLRFNDVKRCIDGLYHTASKNFHGHQEITINAQSWSDNEILSLGAIFEYFQIQWKYYNAEGILDNYPYKISLS
ncbi:24278_t:CDS:2 [Cetraspora pellucida]|uniref:24278_t:CDS:1 n=1 Tax=Cetraspora pellucida TaxID=1433469 RepID=A0A9N9GNS0_9GLOM|nr:24278_t:CDS:2 [Cetraspora pellucida]